MNRSQFLSNMVKNNGHVTASALVEAARSESNPFHKAFEWDDTAAGHEYRLSQARRLIRVTKVSAEGASKPQPLIHVQVANRDEGEYFPRNIVLECPSKHARAFAEVLRLHTAVGVLLAQLAADPEDVPATLRRVG